MLAMRLLLFLIIISVKLSDLTLRRVFDSFTCCGYIRFHFSCRGFSLARKSEVGVVGQLPCESCIRHLSAISMK